MKNEEEKPKDKERYFAFDDMDRPVQIDVERVTGFSKPIWTQEDLKNKDGEKWLK